MSQLWLEKDDLENVPAIALPEGYLPRTYRDGDEVGLSKLYPAAMLGNDTVEGVTNNMLRHACFRPERIFLIEKDGELVATASAWVEPSDPGVGYLHMVGTHPNHRGRRLGTIVSVEAIKYTRSEGLTRQRLSTDDWREAGLRMYLRLGYYPLIADEAHPERWRAIGEKLAVPDILARAKWLHQTVEMPLESTPSYI